MKIGIITLPGNFNYGNRLQNYALQHVLVDLGHEVQTVVPLKEKVTLKNRLYGNLSILKSVLLFKYLDRKEKEKSYQEMKKIKEKYFSPFTSDYINNFYLKNNSLKELKKINSLFDLFVIGSDQVWNPYYISNYDFYFAKFAEQDKRVSYAASFGVSEIPEKVSDKYVQNINDMNKISVRESAGADIVKKLTNRDVDVVLDPTLLLTKEEWLDLAAEDISKNQEQNYILIYFLNDQVEDYKEKIDIFVKNKNLKIITIMGDYVDDEHIVTEPKGFINLINGADYVFTDSFHAVVFSILMQTKFLAFKRGKMNSRIETLLKTCGLEENYNPIDNNEINKYVDNMDFSNVEDILKLERSKSRKILSEILS